MNVEKIISAAPVLPKNEAAFQGYRRLTDPFAKHERENLARVLIDMRGIVHCIVNEKDGPAVWRKGLKLQADNK